MSISDLIQGSVESWSKSWGNRLKEWSITILSKGIELILDIIGKGLSKEMSPLLESLKTATKDVPELNALVNSAQKGGGEWQALLLGGAAGTTVGGSMSSLLAPVFNKINQDMSVKLRWALLDISTAINLYLRKDISLDELRYHLSRQGIPDTVIDMYIKSANKLYGVAEAVNLWRRGKLSDANFATELKAQGFDDSKIEGIKTMSEVLPSASDIVRFAVREAYTPEVAEKYGQYQDFPENAMADAKQVGLSKDLFSKYWAAHWELPSPSQGYEMLHRGIISYDELKTLLRTLDVMPYWRDRLIKIAYTPYTRVDARRMWDMGILNDDELYKSYQDEGYDNEHAKGMTLWTKVFMSFPDLIARYKNGYIKLDEVKSELLKLGMSESRANWLIESKVKPEAPARVQKERDLTKAEIIKGLLKSVINEAEARQLLQDMGYDANEVEIIIAINAPSEDSKKAQAMKSLTKSDIINSLKKDIITSEDAISRLVALRYSTEDAKFLVDLALATKTTVIETKQKELTKADITKGVKLGLIDAETGYLWLQDIGYSPENADYILALTITPTTGSPDTFSEFKSITQAWRQSQGLKAKPVPLELVQAEWNVKAAQAAFELGRANKVSTDRLTELSKTLSDAQAKYRELLTKYQQAK